MSNYSEIEKKWQDYWEENETFKTDVRDFSKPKYYALDMFPYPSGQGLHVGHPEGYTATDIMSRMKRMQGYNVLHPMGWDAFGLPAEQYAVKTGNHPSTFTEKNIETFKKQLKMLGFSYDWSREISTADPKYYKWTQWIFKQLYRDKLAEVVDMPVNWCEELGTVLSNDEVIDGKSERGGFPVVRKNMKQWVMKITEYADQLIDQLDELDWPLSTKEIERNWIGRSYGAEVTFKVSDTDYEFVVFTTRCDTLFGATYCVLSPEHKLVNLITTSEYREQVEAYQTECSRKSEMERTELNHEKTGVFTGAYAINPVNQKKIPIWIADYVLATYGTGAIMAVPAHDERDYEFAKKYDLEIVQVLEEETGVPHKSEIKKNSIVAIIYDQKDNKYLTLNWHDQGGRLFIGGTRRENESVVECALREIREETGYTDLTLVDILPSINHHYYAYNKDQYFNIESTGLLFYLHSDQIDEQSLEDDEVFDIEWVSAGVIEKEILDELHQKTYQYATQPGAMCGDGIHIQSEFLNGLGKEEAISKMLSWLEENNCGIKRVNYRLRDWIFARQRYWGEPVPVVHMEDGSVELIDDEQLPLVLPEMKDYKAHGGKAPLDNAKEWKNVVLNGKKGVRETSTMPGAAGSSWYFLRYIDPHNDEAFADYELLKHWMPVDLYLGGPEHAVGHLLYARFWNNYLYDKGLSPVKEPFQKLVHQGMILGPNGEKMSKSKGNVINPDEMVQTYGADTLRLYEMFMGPLSADKPWNPKGVEGSKKFVDKVYRRFHELEIVDEDIQELEKIYHQTVKKVTNDYESMDFNTAISQMMIFMNELNHKTSISRNYAEGFIKLFNPICPHITEEIWNTVLGHEETIAYEEWPKYDESKLIEDEKEIAVQVNGKVRATITINIDDSEDVIKEQAMNEENVLRHIEGKEVVKVIVIKGKIVNIVVK